ncbi:MAG TPA: hypothetical protein VFN52_02605 [Acidiferrobacteraceae bacterium]|nr:hypothetical protein [Acidiferrobacteraceae bacterium]
MANPSTAWAHALAGQRLFPATLSFDDPGVVSELPMVMVQRPHNTMLNAGLSKTITRRLGFSVATGYDQQNGSGQWQNGTVALAYQVFRNGEHESIGMVQLADTIGGVGPTPWSVYTPEFAFGQGMGLLPHRLRMLRPLAFTGALSMNVPAHSTIPRTLNWALSAQYSVPYLQDFVRDEGLHGLWRNLIPIVELPMQRCESTACAGQTSGAVDPGVIWVGHDYQVGLEASFPINSRSGHDVGVLLGVDLYLDDIAPHRFGRPLLE